VIDPHNSSNTITKTISVQREKSADISAQDTILFAKINLQTKITANKKLIDAGIICVIGKAEKCSLNFTGENSVGAKSWSWSFGD
jgi:hypothetical protein